jgi:general secretion pathway protein M
MKASPSPSDILRRLEPRERRVVVGGAIVSAVLLVTVWLVVPFAQHWSARDAALTAARDRWTRLATLVGSTDRLKQTLDGTRRTTAADNEQLLAGATPALAASTLQSLVQRDAGESSVQLERVDAAGEPTADRPGLLAIPVQLSARGDVYGLVDFLARLEHGGPLLVVDELTVNADEGSDPRQALTWSLRLHGLYEGSVAAAEPSS